MSRTLEAIYEEGVLRPLEDPGLHEHQRVVLELREVPDLTGLEAWHQVYSGLSDQEIFEVESLALDRSRFLRPEP